MLLLLRLFVQQQAYTTLSPHVLLLQRCLCLAALWSLHNYFLLLELSAACVPSPPELTVTPRFPRLLVPRLLVRVCFCLRMRADRSPGKPRISGTANLDFTLELVAVPGKDDEILEMNGLMD